MKILTGLISSSAVFWLSACGGGAAGKGGSAGSNSPPGGTGGAAGRGADGSGQGGNGGAAGTGDGCFDVAKDFSLGGANPSGPWEYGISDSLGSDLHLFSLFTGVSASSELAYWSNDSTTAPSALLNASAVDQHLGGTTTYAPGEFILHPGSAGQLATARWTAPAAGMVHVEATFTGRSGWKSAPVTTTDVHLLVNSAALASGFINVGGNPNEYSLSQDVPIAPGDRIDFAVGYGNGSYLFDSTALAATLCFK